MNYLMTSRYSINKRGGKRQTSSTQPQAITQIKENSVMSNLFTAVSVEQQEIVSGGFDLANYTVLFNGVFSQQAGRATAGFNGGDAFGGQSSLSSNTVASTTLATNAPAVFRAPVLINPVVR
ncbi:hypothetical protein MEN41_12220 [Dolichospermum sp. ST_con]|nr:hypothetical protein [Dolichospermum sp. ST_con]MDD1441332.1 hypothetical protein [Dolichospermum sp. ST_sed3]